MGYNRAHDSSPLRMVATRLEIWVAGLLRLSISASEGPELFLFLTWHVSPVLGERSACLCSAQGPPGGQLSWRALPGSPWPMAPWRSPCPSALLLGLGVCHLQVFFSQMSTPSNQLPALISLGNSGQRLDPPFPERRGGQAELSLKSADAPGPYCYLASCKLSTV